MDETPAPSAPSWLDLYDWRTRVAAMYRARNAAHASGEDPRDALERFRGTKDALFRGHPQSPLEPNARETFTALAYFLYEPTCRVTATFTPIAGEGRVEAPSSGPQPMPLQPAATVTFALAGQPLTLTVFWIDVYGGGLFLPFRDATGPAETYGAGRYLFDTVKGSDFERPEPASDQPMGFTGGEVILDFNYAYNPSCAYDARWACPLAPHENWLSMPIHAGERRYDH